MAFPETRLRRFRRTPELRRLVRETRLSADDLVLPLFVCPGEGVANPVSSMPGVFQHSVDQIVETARGAYAEGIRAVLLFGLPESKDAVGSSAWSADGIVQRALRALAKEVPGLVKIVDVCFCEYTDHGHCGVLHPSKEGGHEVDNDATLENLAKQSVSLAEAGADVIAPSDMMDGRVGAIRYALDEAGFSALPILSYAVKFASGFYGPFREAAESAPKFGDRRSYQMDPANGREALREAELDVQEGADMLMVKPALAYLDILAALRQSFDLPLAAYHVSGEYAMLKAAAERGWIDYNRVMMESLLAIRRAGADLIITYAAREAARLLAEGWTE
ncbi:MAG TPA: porphobilinogen synthase [Thermoanaerobaculia bacterium]|jgi:porphobilinogen synthase|nr:porphobilinogen synthase [Thermoanaerobaculia bacterium]